MRASHVASTDEVLPSLLSPSRDAARIRLSPVTTLPHPDALKTAVAYRALPTNSGLPQPLIAEIRYHHRLREDFHRAEKRLTLQIKAICRRHCDGSLSEAGKLYAAITKGAPHDLAQKALAATLPLMVARDSIKESRCEPEKRLKALAADLPVWGTFVEGVRGFGALGLAQIVGECGDLTLYANPAKLWTRMGVGINSKTGERQRKRAGPAGIEEKYSPRRRAVLFCIGDAIIKSRGDYRALYDAKKAEYEETRPGWTKMHRHRAAQRYMEKRLLRDLWRAWRRCG